MTQKDPLRFLYSNTNENGHFNIPKVIINITNSVTYFFNDYKGEYGMTGWVFGIKISSKEEGENIIKALGSEKFKLVLEASKWSPMVSIEWKIFKLFRKDFWKEFI